MKFFPLRNLALTGSFLLITLQIMAAPPFEIKQSYEIYQQDKQYKVRGRIDFKEYFSSTKAHEAIQRGLNLLTKGGELYIHQGTYSLEKQINIPSHVSLKGSGSGTALVIGKNHDTGVALLCKDKNRITIADLAIKAEGKSAKTGISIENSGDCTVKDVFVMGMQEYGILLTDDTFLSEVRGCKIAGVKGSGIALKKLQLGGRGGDFVPNLITNCIVYNSGIGIECDNAIVANLVGCVVYQTHKFGFFIHSESNSVLISGCRTFQITGEAVHVDASHEINITGNTFCWQTGHGIVLNNVKWGTVSGNNVIDNGSINLFNPAEVKLEMRGEKRAFTKKVENDKDFPLFNGIYLKSGTKGITISGNAIFNWPVCPPMQYGIEEDETCFTNIISTNNINYCKKDGVLSKGKQSQAVNNVMYLKAPHIGTPKSEYQYFDTRLMETFMKEIDDL